MAFAVDIMHGYGLSNKTHSQLQIKKARGALAINIAAKVLYTLYISNKTECSSFESGYVIWVVKG